MEATRKALHEWRAGMMILPGQAPRFVPEPVYFNWVAESPATMLALEGTARALGRLDTFLQTMPEWPAFQRLAMIQAAINVVDLEGGRIRLLEALHREESVDLAFCQDWLRVQQLVSAQQAGWTGPDAGASFLRRLRSLHTALGGGNAGSFRKTTGITATDHYNMFFLPPCPPSVLPGLLDDLDHLLTSREIQVPELLRLAIAAFQLEVLQPFETYNRTTATLTMDAELTQKGWLPGPVGILSSVAHSHATERRRLFDEIPAQGTMEKWVIAWLGHVQTAANRIEAAARRFAKQEARIQGPLLKPFGKRTEAAMRAMRRLLYQPVITGAGMAAHLKVSLPTALSMAKLLCTCGVLRESTGYRRNQIFVFDDIVRVFDE